MLILGEYGDKGDKGYLGDKGSKGYLGEHGNKGKEGPYGEPGLKGPQGEPGYSGEALIGMILFLFFSHLNLNTLFSNQSNI